MLPPWWKKKINRNRERDQLVHHHLRLDKRWLKKGQIYNKGMGEVEKYWEDFKEVKSANKLQ